MDSIGDPYITDTQGRVVKVGEQAAVVFRAFGGKSPSGTFGGGAPYPYAYDYPIRGSGHGDAGDSNDDSYQWWQICVTESGRVASKQRAPLGDLPTFCPGSN